MGLLLQSLELPEADLKVAVLQTIQELLSGKTDDEASGVFEPYLSSLVNALLTNAQAPSPVSIFICTQTYLKQP